MKSLRTTVRAVFCLVGISTSISPVQADLVSFDFVGEIGNPTSGVFQCADMPSFTCPPNVVRMSMGDRFGGRITFDTDTVGTADPFGLINYGLSGAGASLTVGINGGQSFSTFSIFIRNDSAQYPDSFEIRTPDNTTAGSPLYAFSLDLWGNNLLESNALPTNPPNLADAVRNDGYLSFRSNPNYIDSFTFRLVSLTVTPVPEPDTTPPVLTLPANITVDATSPAGAMVTYTVTATDNLDPTPTISCSRLSGLIFAIGTTTVSCRATDGSNNSSTGSFTVTVNGAVQQLQKLISSIGIYTNPWTTSLDAKLQNAMDALTAMRGGNASSACNLLSAFIKEVQAQSGKQLTVAMASELIAKANQIRAVLGCS